MIAIMRTEADIRAKLHTVNQTEVAGKVGLDQPKINNITHSKRGISYDEGCRLVAALWPDAPAPGELAEAQRQEERTTAIEDILLGLRALLPLTVLGAKGHEDQAEALLRALPAIAQAARASRLKGNDVPSAVSAIALHLWSESFPEARLQ